MNKGKIWAGMLLIFLAGICTGAVSTKLFLRHRVIAMLNEGPPAIHRLITQRLTRQLDLNPQQQVLIEQQVRATQQRILALRSQYQPEAAAILGEGVREMRKDLSPEQQKKLEQLYREMRQRLSRYHAP
ncbi:MAG: hypothetical protein AB7E77_08305 [Desulfobulbus sp.]